MRFDVASILADYDICCQNLTVHICSDCPDRDCYRDPKSKSHHTRAWSVGTRLDTQSMQIDNDTNIVVRVILRMQRQCFRMWRGRLHLEVTFLRCPSCLCVLCVSFSLTYSVAFTQAGAERSTKIHKEETVEVMTDMTTN